MESSPFAIVEIFPGLLGRCDQLFILSRFLCVFNRVDHSKLSEVCLFKFVSLTLVLLNLLFSLLRRQLDFLASDHALLYYFFALSDPLLLALRG